ncbi:MAG: SAM-dependent methyltransferase [Asgard group archaeon]|nr:SAM-dependent methyltransferase [Asgard group archaeon]
MNNKFINMIINDFKEFESLVQVNQWLRVKFGFIDFFSSEEEFSDFISFLEFEIKAINLNDERLPREFGDIQTPPSLVNKILQILVDVNFQPEVILEPTFGLGNFILGSLEFFKKLEAIYGIEIHQEYKWMCGLQIIRKIIDNKIEPSKTRKISLLTDDFFNHKINLNDITQDNNTLLILGNPPWVTISELSSLNSTNIPPKSNIKNYKGIDAITGKSNFDITEYILNSLLTQFHTWHGKLAILCKDIVIKNLIKDLLKTKYKITNIKAYEIDTLKEFNIRCNASLLLVDLGISPTNLLCEIRSINSPNDIKRIFGWVNNKFVADYTNYNQFRAFDGISEIIWRQGIKHDCSKILELQFDNEKIRNKQELILDIESDLIYPYMKSSDLQTFNVKKTNRRILITQKRLNQDTNYIKKQFPKTWFYLKKNEDYFSKRKSKVYDNKPLFAIFGVGDYTFLPYKIAISGFYKKPIFTLVEPIGSKSVLFDDTVYYASFSNYKEALFIGTIMNSEISISLLKTLAFVDAKRPYTKEILMRIDNKKIADILTFDQITDIWKTNNFTPRVPIAERDWINFNVNFLNSNL